MNVVHVYNISHSFLHYVFKISIPNKQKSKKRDIETHTKVQRDRHTNVDKDTKRERERDREDGGRRGVKEATRKGGCLLVVTAASYLLKNQTLYLLPGCELS